MKRCITIAALVVFLSAGVAHGQSLQVVRAHLPAWTKPQVDNKGNLSVTFGSGTEHLFFVGHLDEIGLLVTKINDDGTLSVDRRIGFYDKNFEARPVMVYTNYGPVSGIITPRPDYLRLPGVDDTYDIKDVRIYLGTETKKDTEDLGIKAGDSIMVPRRFTRSFDEHSSCTAMLLALMRLDPSKVNKRITFVWTVEEEVGLNGARALAERSKADYVFTVDRFAIRALDTTGITPPAIANRVLEIARRHNISLDRTDLDSFTDIIQHLVLEF